ncbi:MULTISPECIES: serine/threonine-protein kinase [Nocardia]|uniref:serine/threonine-protein kinase n=1 Tax=Nocardia TaxID=1817 RepID=UPI00237EBDFC|nr:MULTISPECIES: serine/threonine-protein kinase [Nocardia]MDE1671620.1 serine/threonine-protein kinase [Nocardia gipuzkoensis]
MSVQPGDVFAGYRIIRRIGAGGMGAVYLAEHPRLPRLDAVKILDPDLGADAEFRARFEREAELAARLEHPNVVSIYDRGAEGDLLWIGMRYVDGVDAAELVRRGPSVLPARRAVRIVAAAARGLDAAHRSGLLHRDVKPANILVSTADDGSDAVRITDFGIARPLEATASLTTTGSVLASFAYAAPEQLTGGPLDHRADIYSLGCTLYEMLTGAVPFGKRTPAASLQAHLYEPPPRPSLANPALPTAIDEVVVRAMAKNPAARYASCAELAAAAIRALEPAPLPLAPAFPPPPPRAGAGRSALIAGAVALVVIATLAVVLLRTGERSGGTPVAAPPSVVSSAMTTTAATSTPAASAWGPAAYIVEAFPNLLPSDPEGVGYQGIRCALNDDRGAWLHCPAATDDGINVNIRCDPSRRPVAYTSDTLGRADLHEQPWTRPSGAGTVRWATDSLAGFGLLDVAFTDHRSFCTVGASGGTGGQDVYDRWWSGAPI